MNKKFGFILFLAITLFALGCREDANLGLDFLPESDMLDIQINDTSTINVFTVLDDSLETNLPTRFLLGVYNDPIFGRMKAGFATQILLDESNAFHPYYLEGNAESLVIKLPIDTISESFYGNTENQLQIKVYRISQVLSDTVIYYSNDLPADYHDGELLGTSTLQMVSNDTIEIELNDEIAQEFIDNSMTYFDVSDVYSFPEKFYGFYFSVEDDGSSDGFIARFNINAKAVLSYYPENDPDSLYSYNFQINSSCVSFNLFSYDYEGTPIEYNTENSDYLDSVAYLQSMGGTKIKLEFPYLSKLDTVENMVLNKAELVIKTENSILTSEETFPAINITSIVGYDTNNDLILLDDFMSGTVYTGVEYSDNEYRFNVTRQIENIIYSKSEDLDYSLYIIPLQRRYNFGRSVITTGKHSNPMKLILTYSKY